MHASKVIDIINKLSINSEYVFIKRWLYYLARALTKGDDYYSATAKTIKEDEELFKGRFRVCHRKRWNQNLKKVKIELKL